MLWRHRAFHVWHKLLFFRTLLDLFSVWRNHPFSSILDFLDFCNVRSWFVHPYIPRVLGCLSFFINEFFFTYQKRKEKSRGVERKIKTSNLNTPYWHPNNLIKANSTHFRSVNSVHKSVKRIFLPILWWTMKMKISMNPPTKPTHNLRHWRVPCQSLFESTIPTLYMLPKLHSNSITHIIP